MTPSQARPPMLPSDPPALAALLLAVDPQGLGGALLAGSGGPAPEGWCRYLRDALPRETPWRRIPVGVTPDRMTGGIELGATLREGRRVLLPGIPAEAHGGVLLLPSAERIRPEVATVLLEVMDRGRLRVEREGISDDLPARVGVVALDEALPEEAGIPEALRDRLAFHLPLPARWTPPGPPDPALVAGARRRLPEVVLPDAAVGALAVLSTGTGGGTGALHPSLRPGLLALKAARALAALRGERAVSPMDTWLAAALVLGPRGFPLPPPPSSPEAGATSNEAEEGPDPGEAPPPPAAHAASAPLPPLSPPPEGAPPHAVEALSPPPPLLEEGSGEASERSEARGALPDRLVSALAALLPDELDGEGRPSPRPRGGALRGGAGGRGGVLVEAHERGRRIGAEPGAPGRGRRLDLPATLRAAAPWQRLRREGTATSDAAVVLGDLPGTGGGSGEGSGAGSGAGAPPHSTLQVTPGDLHVQRRVRPSSRRTIFVVDASGSQALRRLGEVKGAVELLLAESYRAREEVALVVFRDRQARLLLPPTRSLTRAKRLLRGLPGGGGTPLALGLERALVEAEAALRQGVRPRILLLTDGRPNVDARGRGGREAAREDALRVARRMGALGTPGGGPARGGGLEIRVLDTGLRPEPFLETLAEAMGAPVHHLPFADARRIRRALDAPSTPEPRRA